MNDRDLDAGIPGEVAAGQPPGEEGQVGDFFDDGLGDASPALRNTGASPSWSPRTIAGSTRWSRQVMTITRAAGTPSGTGVKVWANCSLYSSNGVMRLVIAGFLLQGGDEWTMSTS